MSFIAFSLLTLGLHSAQALPLLSQNAAQNIAASLTLYPDHENPNQFYFMPNSSTFAREAGSGLPMFGLTYWGLGAGQPLSEAGAYMVFSMRLHSDREQRAALESFIRSGRSVSVLPVQTSTVGLTSTREGEAPLSRLFDEFNFSRKGGRAEDEIAVNAILSGIGAKVFLKAVENPAALKIDYCYSIQGLGPDFDAVVEVDWSRVYDHFQANASGGGWFFKWQAATEIEKLRQNNAVKIHVNGGTATDEEYVKNLAERVVARLFVPELQARPTAGTPQGGWSFISLSLKYTRREELKHERWELKRRQLLNQEFCVPVVLGEISSHRDRLVRNADAL